MPSIRDRVHRNKNLALKKPVFQLFQTFAPQNIKKLPSKVAHNPTRPRVFSPASIWLCGTETVL